MCPVQKRTESGSERTFYYFLQTLEASFIITISPMFCIRIFRFSPGQATNLFDYTRFSVRLWFFIPFDLKNTCWLELFKSGLKTGVALIVYVKFAQGF